MSEPLRDSTNDSPCRSALRWTRRARTRDGADPAPRLRPPRRGAPPEVHLQRVWALPAAVVAELEVGPVAVDEQDHSGEEPAENAGSRNPWRLASAHKAPVAELLRAVGDAASQVGVPAPVLGLLRPPAAVRAALARMGVEGRDEQQKPEDQEKQEREEEQEKQEKIVEAWNADQDWNRGDFIVEWVMTAEKAEDRVRRLSQPLTPDSLGTSRLSGARTVEALSDRLRELADKQGDQETRNLLETLAKALPHKGHEGAVAAWAEALLERARERWKEAAEEGSPASEPAEARGLDEPGPDGEGEDGEGPSGEGDDDSRRGGA